MVDLDEKNTDAFRYYNEIYAYEVLPESDFEPVSDQGKAGDGAGKHAGEDEPRKDANGYYVGLNASVGGTR